MLIGTAQPARRDPQLELRNKTYPQLKQRYVIDSFEYVSQFQLARVETRLKAPPTVHRY